MNQIKLFIDNSVSFRMSLATTNKKLQLVYSFVCQSISHSVAQPSASLKSSWWRWATPGDLTMAMPHAEESPCLSLWLFLTMQGTFIRNSQQAPLLAYLRSHVLPKFTMIKEGSVFLNQSDPALELKMGQGPLKCLASEEESHKWKLSSQEATSTANATC